jgi:hypothetical protein
LIESFLHMRSHLPQRRQPAMGRVSPARRPLTLPGRAYFPAATRLEEVVRFPEEVREARAAIAVVRWVAAAAM